MTVISRLIETANSLHLVTFTTCQSLLLTTLTAWNTRVQWYSFASYIVSFINHGYSVIIQNHRVPTWIFLLDVVVVYACGVDMGIYISGYGWLEASVAIGILHALILLYWFGIRKIGFNHISVCLHGIIHIVGAFLYVFADNTIHNLCLNGPPEDSDFLKKEHDFMCLK